MSRPTSAGGEGCSGRLPSSHAGWSAELLATSPAAFMLDRNVCKSLVRHCGERRLRQEVNDGEATPEHLGALLLDQLGRLERHKDQRGALTLAAVGAVEQIREHFFCGSVDNIQPANYDRVLAAGPVSGRRKRRQCLCSVCAPVFDEAP